MTVDPKGIEGVIALMETFGWSVGFRRDINIDYGLVGFGREATMEPPVRVVSAGGQG